MEVIKDWWQHPLAEDVHECLRLKELSIPPFKAQSPQLCTRRYLVDWLAAIGEKLNLCSTSRHLTTLLLDIFMDSYYIEEEHLKLISMGCLLLACKFEERELNIPKQEELNEYFSPGIEPKTYLKIELKLLKAFDWCVGYPTQAHFAEYYLQHALDGISLNEAKLSHYVSKYVNYFLEISMQDHVYRDYRPSLIASASVASARSCLKCKPCWTIRLEKLTCYSWDDISKLVDIMLKTLHCDEASQKQASSMIVVETPPRGPNSPVSPTSSRFYTRVTQPIYHANSTLCHQSAITSYPGRKS